MPDHVAAEWWIADPIADPEWAVFLSWRCQLVAGLVAEVRVALPQETALAVIPMVRRDGCGLVGRHRFAPAWGSMAA